MPGPEAADRVFAGEIRGAIRARRPDGAYYEVLVAYRTQDDDEEWGRFTVPAGRRIRVGDPVRVVLRSNGALRLARAPGAAGAAPPDTVPARWWPPPNLRTGVWGMVVLLMGAVLVAGIAWAAVHQRTSQLPTGPPATPTAGVPVGGSGGVPAPSGTGAVPSGSGAPAGSAGATPTDSDPPYEPGR
ncbi:MAG TPA: hypothetical protein VGN37_08520 [Actinocatenispora sp.]